MKTLYFFLVLAAAVFVACSDGISILTKTPAENRNILVLPKRGLRSSNAATERTEDRGGLLPKVLLKRGKAIFKPFQVKKEAALALEHDKAIIFNRLQVKEEDALAVEHDKAIFNQFQVEENDAWATLTNVDNMKKLETYFASSTTSKLIHHFNNKYGEDEMMLALGEAMQAKEQSTKESAEKLLDEQLQTAVEEKVPAVKVFNALLPPTLESLVSPKMEAMKRFITLSKNKYGLKDSMLGTVATVFGGLIKLTQTVNRAKLYSQREIALHVENWMITVWMHSKFDPPKLLQVLKMDQNVDALRSSCMDTVIKFTSAYNDANRKKKYFLLTEFTSKFGDDAVAMALLQANKVRVTEKAASILETEEFQTFLSPSRVVALLKKQTVGSLFLESPIVEFLPAYAATYNSKRPQSEWLNEFSVLVDGFGDGDFALTLSRAIKTAATSKDKRKYQQLQISLFRRWKSKLQLDPSSVRSTFFDNVDKSVVDEVELVVENYKRSYDKKSVTFDEKVMIHSI